jgi:hypothetical protein
VQQLQVNILDDDVVESTEQFSVVLNSQDAKVTIGTHGTATVSIIDNDRKYFTRCHRIKISNRRATQRCNVSSFFLCKNMQFTGQEAEQPASTACLLGRKCH